jgi:hypothetical protein
MRGQLPYAIDGRSTIQAEIEYHDYALHYLSIDAEWSRHRSPARMMDRTFRRVADEFTTICAQYRDRVDGLASDLHRANRGRGAAPKVAPYLYNPLCLTPFGHADDLAFVLVDDFHPVNCLSSEIDTTVEEVGVALCPRARSFDTEGEPGTVSDLHTLLRSRPKAVQRVAGQQVYEAVEHPIQKSHPLSVFTRYKMDGLAAVGLGMLCQQALFRLMARRIHEVKKELLTDISRERDVSLIMSSGDVRSCRCVFLDLQGTEEIGTLFFCRNYSVAMAMVTAFRSITFEDVFREDPRIPWLMARKEAHRAFAYVWGTLGGESNGSITDFRRNHAFRWTESTLAVTPSVYLGHNSTSCHGCVQAVGEFLFSPGHLRDASKNIIATSAPTSRRTATRLAGTAERRDSFYFCMAGRHDEMRPYGVGDTSHMLPLIPLPSLLEISRGNLHRFGTGEWSQHRGRAVVDFATEISVPIPRMIGSGVRSDRMLEGPVQAGHLAGSAVLREIRRRVFHTSRATAGSGRLDIDILRDSLRALGVPSALRRTTAFLFQNFGTLLADPFLYDAVLDVYDPLAALHAVLTDGYRAGTNRHGPRMVAGEETSREIAEFVEAINNAMTHRVLKPHLAARVRDMGVDFRGAMNQIVSAADVPLKCGLGLLRKFALGVPFAEDRDKRWIKEHVAAVSRVSLTPGATCHELGMALCPDAILGYFNVDASHFLHVSSYGDHLHEVFHLIYGSHGVPLAPPELSVGLSPIMEDRLSEAAVMLLCLLFVFDGDVMAFLHHNIATYAGSLASEGRDEAETFIRFVEFTFRLFLASYPFWFQKSCKCLGWSREEASEFWKKQENAREHFLGLVQYLADYHGEMRRTLRNGVLTRARAEYCKKHFDDLFGASLHLVPTVYAEAIQVYKTFKQKTESKMEKQYDHRRQFQADVAEAFSKGRPLVRNLYRNPRFYVASILRDEERIPSEDSGIDALALLCEVMHQYMAYRHEQWNLRRRIHLYRDPVTGMVDYNHREKGLPSAWNTWQIDRGLNSLFSPDPKSRRDRLRRQIVILKTCWDMASNLKARRLRDMIKDNWPEARDALERKRPRRHPQCTGLADR